MAEFRAQDLLTSKGNNDDNDVQVIETIDDDDWVQLLMENTTTTELQSSSSANVLHEHINDENYNDNDNDNEDVDVMAVLRSHDMTENLQEAERKGRREGLERAEMKTRSDRRRLERVASKVSDTKRTVEEEKSKIAVCVEYLLDAYMKGYVETYPDCSIQFQQMVRDEKKPQYFLKQCIQLIHSGHNLSLDILVEMIEEYDYLPYLVCQDTNFMLWEYAACSGREDLLHYLMTFNQ